MPLPRFIEANGERLSVADWARRTGVSRQTIHERLKAGWSDEEAVLVPKQPRSKLDHRSIARQAHAAGLAESTVRTRLARGETMGRALRPEPAHAPTGRTHWPSTYRCAACLMPGHNRRTCPFPPEDAAARADAARVADEARAEGRRPHAVPCERCCNVVAVARTGRVPLVCPTCQRGHGERCCSVCGAPITTQAKTGLCYTHAIERVHAAKTTEERAAIAKAAQARKTPEQRSAAVKKQWAVVTDEEREARGDAISRAKTGRRRP